MTPTNTAEKHLTLTRTFNAPRQLVFDAWTKPELVAKWWGPEGYTTPHCKIDLRVGGSSLYCMRSPNGDDMWCGGVFQEIDPPKKFVMSDYFCDEHGKKIKPTDLGLPPEFPEEMTITVTFEENDGKTTVNVVQTMSEEFAKKLGAVAGWNQSFDRLAAELESGGVS